MQKIYLLFMYNSIRDQPSPPPQAITKEACIGVLGIQDICHFTSRDIGYYQCYFQGYCVQYCRYFQGYQLINQLLN